MANRLARETSPYLLQHADNPVDWYPWGEEALARARDEDKPILLSVGYSACHWCHVMERESFEDEATAALMNEHFVNVKVDREERPDIDSLYMQAVQALTRSGGWPMTVFLTPDGTPFYGGTYFPPRQYGNMPAFTQLLQSIASAYETRRDEVDASAGQVRDFLRSAAEAAMPEADESGERLFESAAKSLLSEADLKLGGFGGAPKFPQPMNLEVLLRHHRRTGDEDALRAVETTLTAMSRGGIYDQLGGGFARYSTDAQWLVPHFEKMLYDNALLARLYLEAYQATGKEPYRRTATETLDYLLRDMRSPEGGLYSAEDADSEGVEGKFYVWTPQELQEALGAEDARVAATYWGVSERGNFEGKNILYLQRSAEAVAAELGLDPAELEERISSIRGTLLSERGERVRPARDEKVLASWNGLALRALALAAGVTGEERYRRAATELGEFLLQKMMDDGRLRRSYKDGEARIDAYLEDYAAVADGLAALYEATSELRWLAAARDLADRMLKLFWDAGRGAFYDTPVDHEELLTRPRDLYDTAAPSGNSLATETLLRLSLLLDRDDYREVSERVLSDLAGGMEKVPAGFGRLLCALDFSVSRTAEVALVGEPDAGETRALADVVYGRYLPNSVVAGCAPEDDEAPALVPLLAGRETRDGRATVYVCEGYVCQSPTTEPEELARQLDEI
ncbi:thioredoxin domain-containing protein [Rubrobacter aplysinae]|uniref:thioredoxin domain-containing protein n=1 Tax=Rubrobacter aplysinae TaxID=909625 RepID=UPI00064BB802|nr:thioredoxin domain-containing protein [Rubrobacter aplysinae]